MEQHEIDAVITNFNEHRKKRESMIVEQDQPLDNLEAKTNNPEMTVTLTYQQVRYLKMIATDYSFRPNCVRPAEHAENKDAKDALQTALDTLDYDDHGFEETVTGDGTLTVKSTHTAVPVEEDPISDLITGMMQLVKDEHTPVKDTD